MNPTVIKSMKPIITVALAGVVSCFVTGCETTGLSLREHSGVDYPGYVLSLRPSNSRIVANKVAPPIRLAVAQIGESAPPRKMLEDLQQRTDLITSVISLPLPGEATRSYGYNNTPEKAPDYAGRIQTVCQLAQASGADYIFLFGGNMDTWSKASQLSLLDITIIGGVLIPSTEINLEGKGAGVLIDAATGQPVFFVNTENKLSKYTPDFLQDDKKTELMVQGRDDLVQKTTDEFLRQLASQRSK